MNDRLTCYLYDVDWDHQTSSWADGLCLQTGYTPPGPEYQPPETDYVTRNNRLLHYLEYGPDGQSGYELERVVSYTYLKIGHAANIVIRDGDLGALGPEEQVVCTDLALYYTTDGKLWRALWDYWLEDDEGVYVAESYAKLAAREFYYDSPRQRYLVRDIDLIV